MCARTARSEHRTVNGFICCGTALAFWAGAAIGPVSNASAQTPPGTAFTYQGQLKKLGLPENGPADLKFRLWDAASGGNAISSEVATTAVQVSNGLFSVPVDFGSFAPFQGPSWIEVQVRTPGDGGVYTTLSPRQAVTAAPNALIARSLAGPSACYAYSGTQPALEVTNYGGGGAFSYAILARSSANDTALRAENRVLLNYGELGTSTRGVVGVSVVPSGHGVYGTAGANATSGLGVYGLAQSASGSGVLGYHQPSGNSGWLGQAGFGVQGYASTNSSVAVQGNHQPSGKVGLLGSSEAAVKGTAPGAGTAVYGISETGIGVTGQATGNGLGVYGTSATGFGVSAYSASGSAVNAIAGTGGVAVRASCDNGTALWCTNAVSGLAARFDGFTNFNNNIGIGVPSPTSPIHHSSGARLTGGGIWTNACDRDLKENFQPVDAAGILEKVESLPLNFWNYKVEPGVTHVGPTAQDFKAAFGLSDGDTTIATADADGVALAAIQALSRKVRERDAEVALLREQNAQILHRLSELERRAR